MLCQECSKREKCRKACKNLRQHLEKLENSRREPSLIPLLMNQAIQRPGMSEPDSEQHLALEEVEISVLLRGLTRREQLLLQDYFWEGESLQAIARKKRLSLGRARRLFEATLEKLKRLILSKSVARGIFLPPSAKDGYNKKPRHEKGQSKKNRRGSE